MINYNVYDAPKLAIKLQQIDRAGYTFVNIPTSTYTIWYTIMHFNTFLKSKIKELTVI